MADTAENSPKWWDVVIGGLGTVGNTYAEIVKAQNSGNTAATTTQPVASQTPIIIQSPAAAPATPEKKDNTLLVVGIIVSVLVVGAIIWYAVSGSKKTN